MDKREIPSNRKRPIVHEGRTSPQNQRSSPDLAGVDTALEPISIEEKVNFLEQSLARAKLERAQAQSKLKDSTLALARVGHDLRQPIHAANLFLGALKFEKDPTRILGLVEKLERSLSGIDELLCQTLNLAQIESGRIAGQAQTFALDPLLDTIETRFSSVAKERGLSWKVRGVRGLIVKTDPTIMTEILMNLLSNAFRYSQVGGVLLAVRVRQSSALIQVWDTGIGISNSNLPHIFNDFYQIGASNQQTKKNSIGTGLGLGIVKRLAAFLGLAVNVRSTLGRGSRFEIRVPLGKSLRQQEPQTAFNAEQGQTENWAARVNPIVGALILVVDNHQEILLATQSLLSSWGAHVLLARNVAEALVQIHDSERLPDVIITDHSFADEQFGVDVIRECRSFADYSLPALVQTAHEPETISGLYRLMPVLRKPVKPALLFENLCLLLTVTND
jgi:two-component system, sensor histidine kinase